MLSFAFNGLKRAAPSLIAACCAFVIVGPAALGQRPASTDAKSRHAHCGKAHAAARQLEATRDERPQALPAAYRESLGETDVLHYHLDIEITDINPTANTCTITGTNAITVKSRSAALTEFSFRLRSQYAVTGADVDGIPVTVQAPTTTTRVATLDRTYGLDEVFTLTIPYSGTSQSVSWGTIEVTTHSGGTVEVSTLSEPYYSYTWWPAKDGDVLLSGDNSDKATLDFWITVPDNFTVAANGILEGTDTLTGSRKRFRWSSDYPIATYLVSFAASEYNTWTQTYTYPGGTMPVEFFIYDSWDNSSNRESWEKCLGMLETFSSLFGEYPFVEEKYGIYNFSFGGGMEHQTITGQGGFSEWLTAHELAHQWWGDAVTCRTWNDIWLNEGFASYSEALWDEFKPGSSGLPDLMSTMSTMKYTGGGSVYVYNYEVSEIGQIFNGSTSYNKGAWVVHMLRHVLGDDAFWEALAAYRAAFEGSAATTADFQALVEGFYDGGDLDWFFQEWVYGEYAPAYTWGWDTVQVSGQHYLLVYIDQTQAVSTQRFSMPVDIVADGTTYVVFNDADPEHFVIPVPSDPSIVQLDPDAWILWSARTSTGYVPGPPTVVETSPAPGETVAFLDIIDTVTATFHTNVDLAPTDLSLVGAVAGPRSFTIASGSDVNPVTLQFDKPLWPDTYTLTITSGAKAHDTGLSLDGETADPADPASLPSGDGVTGGYAVIEFVVAAGFRLGDFDDDEDVDGFDAVAFEDCYTGPEAGSVSEDCLPGDFDADGDVDCEDWGQFRYDAWTEGDPLPFSPTCQEDIPAASEWGLVVLTLLLLTSGTLILRPRL